MVPPWVLRKDIWGGANCRSGYGRGWGRASALDGVIAAVGARVYESIYMSRGRVSVLLVLALLWHVVVPPASAHFAFESAIAADAGPDSSAFLTGGGTAADLVKVLDARRLVPVPGVSLSIAAAKDRLPRWSRTAPVDPTGCDRALCNLYLRLTRSDPGEAPH